MVTVHSVVFWTVMLQLLPTVATLRASRPLVLVDGSALMYRAYYAMPSLISQGREVNFKLQAFCSYFVGTPE